MDLYTYEGPVMSFDCCVEKHWQGKTYAVSEGRARSNLTYKWKKENNYDLNTKISLPGKIRKTG